MQQATEAEVGAVRSCLGTAMDTVYANRLNPDQILSAYVEALRREILFTFPDAVIEHTKGTTIIVRLQNGHEIPLLF